MEVRCGCGNTIEYSYDELGCVECGQACCPACGVFLESVVYCAHCAGVRVPAPSGQGGRPAIT
jgi:hypothetical protein